MKSKVMIIKGGREVLSFDGELVSEVKESGDGMVFGLLNGFQIQLTDHYMESDIKQKIFHSLRAMKGSKQITINFDNKVQPVSVEN